jgi:hypothetical protein
LDLFWAANYKDVAPTALEFLPTPSASPRFFQLIPRWDGNKVEDMKARRNFIQTGLLCAVMLPAVVNAQFTFTTNNGAITITGYTGTGGDVTIPSMINGLLVTSIQEYAFDGYTTFGRARDTGSPYVQRKQIILTIPDSVTSIGNFAFNNCYALTCVKFGSGITNIGSEVFANCIGLTNVTIGKSVTSIGTYAFGFCTSLTNVTFSRSVNSIGQGAFEGCTRLGSVIIPKTDLEKKVALREGLWA